MVVGGIRDQVVERVDTIADDDTDLRVTVDGERHKSHRGLTSRRVRRRRRTGPTQDEP